MKVGITVDDERVTRYVLGKYDFYTREVDLPEDALVAIQAVLSLYPVAQRIIAAAYQSHGKFLLNEDLEAIKCLTVKTVGEPKTRGAKSAKKPEVQATEAGSSSESLSS